MNNKSNEQQTVSEELAQYFNSIVYEDINPANLDTAKSLLLDYLGVALAGSTSVTGCLAANFSKNNSGQPEATIIGSGNRVSASDAAFTNAIASHSLEMDDVDKEALFHFGPPVISAALANGEAMSCSGKEFITSIVCGCEMMERVSWATNPVLRNRGFHTTPVAGVFGATIACTKISKLNTLQIVSALGLAGAQSSGLMEMYGDSMQKRFNPGPAARNAVIATRLAQLGFTGTERIFEGERGFVKAFAGEGNLQHLRPQCGPPYHLEVEFKRYACARPIHTAIEATIALRPQLIQRLNEIESIKVYRHPMWANYHTNNHPITYHDAQMSLPYSVAIALSTGDAFLDQYENAESAILKIGELIKKIEIITDQSLPTAQACRIVIAMPGGDRLVNQVNYPKGSRQNPMTNEEQQWKFKKLAGRVLTNKKMEELVQVVKHIDSLSNIRVLTDYLIKGVED